MLPIYRAGHALVSAIRHQDREQPPAAGRKRRASEASLDGGAAEAAVVPSAKAFMKVFLKAQLRAAPDGRIKERKLRGAALAEADALTSD